MFEKYVSTLKETSCDNRNKKTSNYMTKSTLPAVNSDEVKSEYIGNLRLTDTPKSNDALFFDKKEVPFFIEFKNGKIERKESYDIKKKIYDSVLIFTDIVDVGITELRQNMEYILVYNKDANSGNVLGEKKESQIQQSSSFNQFSKGVTKLAKEEFVEFGLKCFENYCFKKVHTYTIEEFEAFLKNCSQKN